MGCINRHSLNFKGNLLFTKPQETQSPYNVDMRPVMPRTQSYAQKRQSDYGSMRVPDSLGSIREQMEEEEVTPPSVTRM